MPDYILGSGVTNIARVPAFEVGDSYSLNDIVYFSGYTVAGSPAVVEQHKRVARVAKAGGDDRIGHVKDERLVDMAAELRPA